MEQTITLKEILDMARLKRMTLINTLTGFKSANLIGSADGKGQHNLAIFNSAVHIGANPPLIGLLFRPTTVARHSYENIRASGKYTINHVHYRFYREAHQTSAKYEEGVSEFSATGLTPQWVSGFPAPFVEESHIKMAMEYVEEYPIKANGTILLIGKILEIRMAKGLLEEDGYVDLQLAGTVAVSGLDTYFQADRLARLSYARPEEALREL